MIQMRCRPLLLLCALFAYAAQAGSPPATLVRVENAWARPTPPGARVGAAFLSLEAEIEDQLESASSPVAEKVEIHSMNMQGGMMQMRPLQSLELPPGRRVELTPEGTHLMLLGLKQPLAPKSRFELVLRFARAGEQSVTVQVRAAGE